MFIAFAYAFYTAYPFVRIFARESSTYFKTFIRSRLLSGCKSDKFHLIVWIDHFAANEKLRHKVVI